MAHWYNEYFYSKEILVYIEKYYKDAKIVLFDFIDSNEYNKFNSTTNLNLRWEDHPTMVEITNYSKKPVREGIIYKIHLAAFEALEITVNDNEDSMLIGFSIDLSNFNSELFISSKSLKDDEKSFRNILVTRNITLPG